MSDNTSWKALEAEKTVESLWKITKVVLDTLEFEDVSQRICDSLLSELGYLNLGYRIIVLSLYDPEKKGLQRIALSQTPQAHAATTVSPIPFKEIIIPESSDDNICIKAFKQQLPFETTDWKDILTPPLLPEDARNNQSAAEIKTSLVYPIILKGKSVGVLIFSLVKSADQVSEIERNLLKGFTDIVGIAIQNSKLYSDLEKTTQNLNHTNQELIKLTKLKDEFVYLASHELRTPLTAIKSYAWMVLNRTGSVSPEVKKYMDVVLNSTERLIHLVNDMLDMSRIESGKTVLKPSIVNLTDIIKNIETEFSARFTEKQLTLHTTYPENISFTADPDKLTQILENLVGNSLKFTPAGGRVNIDIKKDEKQLVFNVSDTGKGIPEADIPKLFSKFGRLENSLITTPESGTGLGLYICKQYVELHGGNISVVSQVGTGTTFTFTIPIS